MKYEPISEMTITECEAALVRNEPDELLLAAISVGLYCDDLEWAQGYLLTLSAHPHEAVRGSAILSFGHLARRFRSLDSSRVKSIVVCALSDSSEFVRGQADSAADDLELFLKWSMA